MVEEDDVAMMYDCTKERRETFVERQRFYYIRRRTSISNYWDLTRLFKEIKMVMN